MTIAINARPEGNGPRTVGAVDSCVSAEVGHPLTIDVVLPAPGAPADRGISAFQFWLLYDPSIVWVQADDYKQLLNQAPGSKLIPIEDPKPDRNGTYASWAIDFGPEGIEPQGASETGQGVLTRLTLLPVSAGHTALTLGDVLLLDDKSQPISVASNTGADLYVGAPCPGEELATPGPTPAPTTEATATPAPASAPLDVPGGGSGRGLAVAGFGRTGGPPGSGGGASRWLLATGAAVMLAGASALVASARLRACSRNDHAGKDSRNE